MYIPLFRWHKAQRPKLEMADEELNDSLKEEIEALEAILSEEDELTLRHESLSDLEIKTRIAPLTASDTSRLDKFHEW